MNCDEIENLLSAQIDGEITGDDRTRLDAHLSGCEACRQRTAEVESLDAALLRAFEPKRETAMALADRFVRTIGVNDVSPIRPRTRFHTWLSPLSRFAAALAIGLMAFILVKPAPKYSPIAVTTRVTPALPTLALLKLSTGPMFVCPQDQTEWRPVSAHSTISQGDTLRTTGNAKCELQLTDGSCVRLDSGTEACFVGDRNIQVSHGQVWSAVKHDAAPLHLTASDTSATPHRDTDTQFELTCTSVGAMVSVQSGSADVVGGRKPATVHAGETLNTAPVVACTAISDPLQSGHWQDDLLVLKPAGDGEVQARIGQLLMRIAQDRKQSASPASTEQSLRATGSPWCPAIAFYLRAQSSDDREVRIAGAALLADLATPGNIEDLIELLDDKEGRVRYTAATALQRLAGLTLDCPPEKFAGDRDAAAISRWRTWWAENKSRYPQSQ